MENAEIQDTPIENEGAEELNLNEFDSGFGIETNSSEEETPTETETIEENEEAEEFDYSPFLENLSKKIKYNGEEVKIDNLEDVIANYQKGKNYDKVQEKLNSLENSEELQYIEQLAKQNGMTRTEYIKAVKEEQSKQELQAEQDRIAEMVSNNVPEEVAKEVVETARLRKEYNEKLLKLEQEKNITKEKEKQNAEYDEFLNAYPDIDLEKIPKEVFVDAKESNLLTAYTKYQLKIAQEELKQLKQNEKIKRSSPIKGVTEHGGTINEKQDPFLMGFNSD